MRNKISKGIEIIFIIYLIAAIVYSGYKVVKGEDMLFYALLIHLCLLWANVGLLETRNNKKVKFLETRIRVGENSNREGLIHLNHSYTMNIDTITRLSKVIGRLRESSFISYETEAESFAEKVKEFEESHYFHMFGGNYEKTNRAGVYSLKNGRETYYLRSSMIHDNVSGLYRFFDLTKERAKVHDEGAEKFFVGMDLPD